MEEEAITTTITMAAVGEGASVLLEMFVKSQQAQYFHFFHLAQVIIYYGKISVLYLISS